MDSHRSAIIFFFIMAYMIMCVGVGLWALRRTKSPRDFFMAGRHLGIMVTALAVFSSTMSGFGFVGGPGLVYQMGTSSFWMPFANIIGYCLTFFLLAKRLRLVAELRDTISLPDAVAARYNSELSRFLTAVGILLGVIGYLGTQILALATVLHDILANVSFIPSIPLEACMAIACAVLVFYCGFMGEGEHALILGFPAPTAWFIYGFWPFQVFFVVVYIMAFNRLLITDDNMARFQEILAAKKRQDGGSA